MTERRNSDQVRLLVRSRGVGTLATAMAADGAPYASMVTYACDQRGQPIFLFSTLSDHTQNLMQEKRASLLVERAMSRRNPQTGPRVSLLGTIEKVKDKSARERFLARHPGAALYVDFGDFAFFRMTVERAHYVGGFARAIWFDAKQVLTPAGAARSIARDEAGIVAHMNSDHGDAVDAYAQGLLGRKGNGWELTGCDVDGLDMRRVGRYARLDFENPLADSNDCRKVLIKLAQRARGG